MIVEDKNISVYEQAKITRNKITKSATLDINTEGEWQLYAGKSVDKIDMNKPIASGKDKGSYSLAVSCMERSYFRLITSYGEAILAENHLPMTGGYNFRDLGGLQASDGRRIQWGKIFRSDDLYHLTDADLSYLADIPIKTIVDFRCTEECELLPDKLPGNLANYCHLEIHPGSLQTFSKESLTKEDSVKEAMKSLYRLFVTEQVYIDTYKEFFKLVQNENKLPLMFHCSAGKDRTGFATALILSALGVPEKTIIRDYMLSNVYLGDKYKSLFDENPINKYLYMVIPDYLEASFNQIKEKHQSIQAFLENQMNIDIEKFRNNLLF